MGFPERWRSPVPSKMAAGRHLGLTKDDPFYYRSYGTPYTSDILHLRVFVNQHFRTQVYGPDAGEIDGKCVEPGKVYAEGTRLINVRQGVLYRLLAEIIC
jgi:hypothetical protein